MKILLIRFSSFGDVTQSLSIPAALIARFPLAEIHWVTRKEFVPLLTGNPAISRVWALDRKSGIGGVFRMALQLRAEKFDRIYDAHNNLRSRLISLVMRFPFGFVTGPLLLRRKTYRWKRYLLFSWRINTFEMPFSGQRDLLNPLKAWGILPSPLPPAPVLFTSEKDRADGAALLGGFASGFVALAPSAAHLLKRWPVENWNKLISLFPDRKFVLLGGPEDTFFSEIVVTAPDRILNLAGRSSLSVSAAIVAAADILVTNDTGLLHVAEQQGRPAIALMGPAPFGFPSRESTTILQIDLPCRPCSKHGQGPCVNAKFQRCMVDLTPELVASHVLVRTGSR